LAGDPEFDGGCLWIVRSDELESMDEATAVRWPQGFGALFDPVRLVDPQGNVVASEGEIVVLGGGSMDPSIVLQRCAVGDGPGWDASSVVRVDNWESVPTPWRRTTGS
jgi:hypothetical protein